VCPALTIVCDVENLKTVAYRESKRNTNLVCDATVLIVRSHRDKRHKQTLCHEVHCFVAEITSNIFYSKKKLLHMKILSIGLNKI
jgi:hypothetical protein